MQRGSMKETVAAALIITASGVTGSAAYAQQQPAENGLSDDSAIVVTARRREENLQDVPISIAALGQEELQRAQIRTEADLQRAVPGLTIRQNGSANQFNYSLRGQSVDTYTGSPPGVLPYINDAQVVTRAATTFYDLASIQVLKGPQGTLFGRNATGGAVLFETAKPSDTFDGYFLGRYGNYQQFNAEGAVSIPVAETVGIRLAGVYSHGGAFVDNLLTGKELGKQDMYSLRGTLVLQPTPNFSNTTVIQHTDEGGTNLPTVIFSAYACGETYNGVPLNSTADCAYGPASPPFNAFINAHANLFPGGVAAMADRQRARGPWDVEINVPIYHDAQSTFGINTTRFDVTADLTLKNIFMYNSSKADDGFDYDGTPYPIFQTGGTPTADATSVTDSIAFIQKTEQISNELQLQGSAADNRLKFVAGAYYLYQRDENDSSLLVFDFSPIVAGQNVRYHQRSTTESKALFAQGTYSLTDTLNLTGGLRWTWEKTTARQLHGSVFGIDSPVEQLKDDKPSWTTSIDYRVTPDLLLYLTHRGSWRAGGYNYSVAPIDAPPSEGGNRFAPETTKDIEAGFKYSGRDLGVPFTFNVAAYHQWVKNIQRAAYVTDPTGGTPSLVTANVPKAKITGVEAALEIRPAQWIDFGLSGAYTHARYTDNLVILNDPQGNPSPTEYGPFADTPKWTGNAYLELRHDLGADTGELALRADVYGQTKLYFTNVANSLAPRAVIPGYALVNGRLSWSNIHDTGLTAAIFVRNLFNEEYYAGGNSQAATLGVNTSVPGRPRMWGGELRFDF